MSTAALPLVAAPAATEADPYVAYSYSYPHKSAYGPLDPQVALDRLWQAERRAALFLYVHIPFCEMRCGFCNLFARAGADEALIDGYLAALERQGRCLDEATAGGRHVSRMALGGGTPTLLAPGQLERVFDLVARAFGACPSRLPTSVETSPKTATPDRLQILRDRGVERVSIGVQSFLKSETDALGRPQQLREVYAALDRLRGFPILNIDLIYGQPTQTVASWLASLRAALRYRPDELYLYPLYVRPHTGIGRRAGLSQVSGSFKRLLYRAGRDLLQSAGYEQVSMRFFQAPKGLHTAPPSSGPVYCCQTDGMVGLGCGARSYTSQVHYSSQFAVAAAGVQAILHDWITREDFKQATWGLRLSEDDRRRRFVLQSLLTRDGLDDADYRRLFQDPVADSFPELPQLVETEMVENSASVWRLTALGLEFSDSIGPSLYSAARRASLEALTEP
jgi:oxygen-independent coproporphyrinogen-3 oxidase